ncbi:hypothetical protein [Nonomuraea sp. NPDC002799]
MLRHALGPIVVAVFAALLVVSGGVAVVTGDVWLLRLLVHRVLGDRPVRFDVDWLLMLLAMGLLQVWALWQILAGRRAAGKPDRDGRLLRIALYVWLLAELADRLWWADIPEEIAQLAAVVLFYRTMRGGSRKLRLVALVAGLYSSLRVLAALLLHLAGMEAEVLSRPWLGSLPWLVWMVLTLVAQARDGRWGRTTLWTGGLVAARPLLMPSLLPPFAGTYLWYASVGLVADVLLLVWLGRSAREVGNPPSVPRPATPEERPPMRWRALQVVAVVLPLVPVVVNVANGVFLWVGPRGAIASWFFWHGSFLMQVWLPLDVLVGIGGGAALVLVAVMRRTRALVFRTIWALLLAAVVGVVSATTASSGRALDYGDAGFSLRIFPDWMLDSPRGTSPLWHSIAFSVSALLLFLLYAGRPPVRRRPYLVVVASTATVAALLALPVSDHAPGRITTASECERGERSGAETFICTVRRSTRLWTIRDMPDQRLVAYGRRLCDVYTRDDPQEATGFRERHGIDPREEGALLVGICPKVDAYLSAAAEEEERELLAMEAEEQAICDKAPRHRPLIKPVRAIREKRPIWPEIPLEAYGEEWPDDELWERVGDNDLVVSAPGHLMIMLNSALQACVTTESYDRRPPVETKGWQRVVEAGYESTDGSVVFAEHLSGIVLPDLASRGKGHYRVRVHHAWLPWKGEKQAGQRLLIMAYPGRGDDVVVHHE